MALASAVGMLRAARDGGYAVGYFEAWNLESLAGVVDAAEAARSPVILGINGEFVSDPGRLLPEPVGWWAALLGAAGAAASVPVATIFNECSDDAAVRAAIPLGFGIVMPIAATGEAEADYAARTAAIVGLAHPFGVAVEAELGTLPHGTEGGGTTTDPGAAAAFAAATGCDLLAVSAGNTHILLEGRKGLDLDRLRAIGEAVDVPLVLHGGTGIADDALRAAVGCGVAKVNFGTGLKQAYLRAVRQRLAAAEPDPHRLLGMGGPEDAMVAGRVAVREAVLEKIALLGSAGKADAGG